MSSASSWAWSGRRSIAGAWRPPSRHSGVGNIFFRWRCLLRGLSQPLSLEIHITHRRSRRYRAWSCELDFSCQYVVTNPWRGGRCTYPLPVIKRAWESREAALLGSTFMNLAMFLCCISWTIHSSPYVEYDIFVLTGNVCGVVVQGAALWTRLYLHHLQEEPTIPESNEQSPLLIA